MGLVCLRQVNYIPTEYYYLDTNFEDKTAEHSDYDV